MKNLSTGVKASLWVTMAAAILGAWVFGLFGPEQPPAPPTPPREVRAAAPADVVHPCDRRCGADAGCRKACIDEQMRQEDQEAKKKAAALEAQETAKREEEKKVLAQRAEQARARRRRATTPRTYTPTPTTERRLTAYY